ncbi:MAG: serpin family protein [Sulfuritalea sp.]|nr:serpin family protein [Sulfuritalea sp.]
MSFSDKANGLRLTVIAAALLAAGLAQAQAGGGVAAGGAHTPPSVPGKDILLEQRAPAEPFQPAQYTPAQVQQHVAPAPVPVARPAVPAPARGATGDMPRQFAFSVAAVDLGLAMLRDQVARQGNAAGNGVYSPFGIASTLGMLHAASAGETRREVGQLLAPGASGDMELTLRLRELLPRMTGSGGVKMQVANGIWVNQATGLQPSAMFRSALNQDYRATMRVLDFSTGAEAVAQINAEVKKQTGGNISRLLADDALGERARFVLTNALHFKGQWATRFDPAQTRPGTFHVDGGEPVQVPMMLGRVAFRETVADNVQVYELPYVGEQFSMLIALPPTGHSLAALEHDLRGADVQGWWATLRPGEGELMMPRVKLAAREALRMRGLLEKLGVKKAFSGEADLTELGAGADAHLDEVFHAATFAMDEEGAEASAATAAVGVSKSFGPPPRRIDRPFLFMIVHKPSRMPVVMGRVARPD